MKINFLKKGILLFALGALFVGCTDTDADDLFSQNVDQRIAAKKAELSEALLSSPEGWKVTYFTDDTQLGGFTYLFQFIDGEHVKMVSDFQSSQLTPIAEPSEYGIVLGSTVSLVFLTRDYIHDLSDSNNYPISTLRGQGYKGDFQFLYYGVEGTDVINFRSNRAEKVPIKFERATTEDWTALAGNFSMMELVRTMKKLYVIEGQEIVSYNFGYNVKSRFASVLDDTKTMSVNENAGIGIGFTSTGVKISPAIELENGTLISSLEYDYASGTFVSANGEIRISK